MNKCDGIKILELDSKRNLEGSEYMVVAEKDYNYKAPINQIVDLVINDSRIKDYIDTTIESSIGDFKNEVNQSISELTSKINNLDSKITTVNNRITNLESSVDDIEQNITSINNKITSIENNLGTEFRFGYVAGNSEKRGQQFIRSYVNSEGGNGKKAEEEFAVVNYFDKTEAGQVVALNPIT